MHDLYIAEIYRPDTILLPLVVQVYLRSLLHIEHRIKKQGALRSFNVIKVIEIETSRKPICDFVLVFHCNCLSSKFYRLRDITIYWSKIYVFRYFIVSFEGLVSKFPLGPTV